MNNMTEKDIKEMARKKKNEYQRKWRKNNPEKVREHQNNYWERLALKEMEGKAIEKGIGERKH